MCGILEIGDLMARYTSDVIGRCAFGVECNGLRNPEAEFAIMGRRAFSERRHCKLVDGFIESFPEVARFLRMRQIHQDITDFYVGIVRETVKQREEQGIVRSDFMNLLIEMKQRGELTSEEMAAQAFIFFAAGFDTSASTLGFALYELAKQPALQAKLREEIDQALRLHNGEFTYDSMQELRYMELVIAGEPDSKRILNITKMIPFTTVSFRNPSEVSHTTAAHSDLQASLRSQGRSSFLHRAGSNATDTGLRHPS